MKTGRKTQLLKTTYKNPLVIIVLFSLFILSSCRKDSYDGIDGRPGMAFLSVNWDVSEPSYLDVGTSDIPEVFEWGAYYRAYPGINTLYYDGRVWQGSSWSNYAWEVDYEIFENPGEYGRHNYNGRDGMNSYFDIVCTPYGPDISNYNAIIKPDPSYDENDVDAVSGNKTITKTAGNYSIKITYKKVSSKHNYNSDVSVNHTTGSSK